MTATARLLCGDVRDHLRLLDAESVQCVVTSPPYFALRSYLPDGHPDKVQEMGAEPTPAAFVAALVDVFREVRRVLRPDGTVWLNLGDSYAGSWGNYGGQNRGNGSQRTITNGSKAHQKSYDGLESWRPATSAVPGLKPKDLIGVPWRVAFALQEDGWYLRSDIIWHKPNPMPESVTDRPTKSHEYLFLLTKRPTYFYDADAIREPSSWDVTKSKMPDGWDTGAGAHGSFHRNGREKGQSWKGSTFNNGKTAIHQLNRSSDGERQMPDGRNKRSVWTVATQPFSGAHFACFPEKLIEPCILAGTSERGQCPACGAPWRRVVDRDAYSSRPNSGGIRGSVPSSNRSLGDAQRGSMHVHVKTTGWQPGCVCDAGAPVPQTVLDPFGGSMTTGVVSLRHGRSFIGIDLNADYVELGRNRVVNDAPLFNKVTVTT